MVDARVRFDVVTFDAIETATARDLLDQERLRRQLNAIRREGTRAAGDRGPREVAQSMMDEQSTSPFPTTSIANNAAAIDLAPTIAAAADGHDALLLDDGRS